MPRITSQGVQYFSKIKLSRSDNDVDMNMKQTAIRENTPKGC